MGRSQALLRLTSPEVPRRSDPACVGNTVYKRCPPWVTPGEYIEQVGAASSP